MEPFSSEEPASIAMAEVNSALLVLFVEAVGTNKFSVYFIVERFRIKQFLGSAMSLKTAPASKIADMISSKRIPFAKALKLKMFASISDPNLQKLGMERIRLVLRASLALAVNNY